MNTAFDPTMSVEDASAQFAQLCAERRRIESRRTVPASPTGRAAELQAHTNRLRSELTATKTRLATVNSKIALLTATKKAIIAEKVQASKTLTARELLAMSPEDKKAINNKVMFGESGKAARMEIKRAFAAGTSAEKTALLNEFRGALTNFPSEV